MKRLTSCRPLFAALLYVCVGCSATDDELWEDDSWIVSVEQPLCVSQELSTVGATSSSNEAGWLGPQYAIDNESGTRWGSAFVDPSWIVVDLGATRHVNRISLSWEAAASKDYDLQISGSASGPWSTLYTDPNGNGGVDNITGLNAQGRYVRMYSRKRTTGYGNSLWELDVYGDPNPSCGETTTPTCGNGIVEAGEQCDDGNSVDSDGCISATCSDGAQNQGETGIDCGEPCFACPTCSDGVQNQGETGVDCGGPCPACVTCSDGVQNQGEAGVDCGGPCSACPSCSDSVQNQGEAGVDCGGPCPACSTGSCGALALTRSGATSSSNEHAGYGPASAIDGSTGTRWSSAFSDPQWLSVDLGSTKHVNRVVLRWEAAASKDYDVQVGNSASGPWTTLYTDPNGNGGVDNIEGLSGTGRYVRMYSRKRTTGWGNSLWEIEVYGDNNPSCQGTTSPVCGNGIVESGEQCDDGNAANSDGCSNGCILATCSDGAQNQGEAGIDCGGPCAACATCSDGIQNQGETGIDCGGPCPACATATCSDGIQNQGETGIDCGGPCPATCAGGSCDDVFGATGFYATAPGGLEWTSQFWSGSAHGVPFGSPDPADPLGLANARGQGTITVNGDGTLSMTGSQPRIYLGTTSNHPWLNVEVTVYYQRLQDDATAWGGFVVGARSGPDGHGTNNCTATTYYARFRHDGRADVEKELEHPASDTRASHYIWPSNGPLPFNQWIGMKYIVYNDGAGGVRLQVFRDLTEGLNGGTWEPIIDYTDNGGWAPASNCSYEDDHIILEGGGVVFIRDTGTTGPGAQYRNFTVREIDPSTLCSE